MARLYTFDSGLKLFYNRNKINKNNLINISFDCGARCDGELAGLSHFTEHMFFTGTKSKTKQEIIKQYFDFMRTNAYTGMDEICFTGEVLEDKIKDYLSSVAEIICESSFSPEAVEEEKKVVCQEIVRSADNYSNISQNLAGYELFKLDMFRNGVLGSQETVNKITSKDVKKYVKKYFVNNNCHIYIASSLSFREVKKLVKNYFEKSMPTSNLKSLPYDSDVFKGEDGVNVATNKIDKNFLYVTFKSDRQGNDLKHNMISDMLADIMRDFSDGVAKTLRIEKSLVYSVSIRSNRNQKCSDITISTEISTQNIKACIDTIIDYVKNLAESGVTKEQIEKQKKEDDYSYLTTINTPRHLQTVLQRYRDYNKFVDSKQMHEIYQQITVEEVNERIKELFVRPRINVFVYGDATKKDVYTLSQIQKKFLKK